MTPARIARCALALVLLASAGGNARAAADRMISIPPAFADLERAPVAFPHDKHTAALEAEGCQACHPTGAQGANERNPYAEARADTSNPPATANRHLFRSDSSNRDMMASNAITPMESPINDSTDWFCARTHPLATAVNPAACAKVNAVTIPNSDLHDPARKANPMRNSR